MPKSVLAIVAATILASAAAAQTGAPPPPPPPPSASGVEDTSRNPDMTGFAAEVDADGDGRLSRAEWQAKGLPDSSFNMFEAGRGYVTLSDYQTHAAPPGIDRNGDGKLTVAEFKAFDREMSARMQGHAPPRR